MALNNVMHPKYSPRGRPYNPVLLVELAAVRVSAAMLLVENLPQPVGLVASGQVKAREAGLQLKASRAAQRRGIAAVLCQWPEPVFQL